MGAQIFFYYICAFATMHFYIISIIMTDVVFSNLIDIGIKKIQNFNMTT